MMKKNILFMLFCLFTLVSCEKEIFSDSDKMMSIEQFSPVLENGAMKLSGCVNLPAEFNRETAKVGFYVAEYNKDMSSYGNDDVYIGDVISAYQYLLYGNTDDGYYYEDKNEFHWVDRVGADGTFEISFVPEMKQYICIAFAANILECDTDGWADMQLLQSKPFFFTGEATALLEQVDPALNDFKLTYPKNEEMRGEVYLCWSSTNQQPHLADNVIPSGYYYYEDNFVNFEDVDFGDNDVVYVRGCVRYEQRVIYSNMIELRPKEVKIVINSQEDFQSFKNSLFVCTDTIYQSYYYRGDDWWRKFRGRIQFNYAVEKADWFDERSWDPYLDSTYLYIPELNGVIEGKGYIPRINYVNETGVVKGMTISYCNTNNGLMENVQISSLHENNNLLKNVQNADISNNYGFIEGGRQIEVYINRGTVNKINHVSIDYNYGSLMESDTVYVDYNYGLVQNCKDVIGSVIVDGYTYNRHYIVNYNHKEGRIIDCTIKNNNENNAYMICYYNYGYMENCLPNLNCCGHNYGVIKNPYSEDDYADENVKEYTTDMFYGTWECDSVIYKEISNGEVKYEYSHDNKSRITFQEEVYTTFWYSYDEAIWYQDNTYRWGTNDGKLILFNGGEASSIEYDVKELTETRLVLLHTQHYESYEIHDECIYHKVQ